MWIDTKVLESNESSTWLQALHQNVKNWFLSNDIPQQSLFLGNGFNSISLGNETRKMWNWKRKFQISEMPRRKECRKFLRVSNEWRKSLFKFGKSNNSLAFPSYFLVCTKQTKEIESIVLANGFEMKLSLPKYLNK